MIQGVFGREPHPASDAKKGGICRDEEKGPKLGRYRGKKQGTGQLHSVIAS